MTPATQRSIRRFIGVLVWIWLSCVLGAAAFGQAANPLVGTWELDLSKSDFTPETAIRERTMVFTAVDNGMTCKMMTLTERGNGRVTTESTYTAHFDNKEVPIDNSPLDTVILKRTDANNYERSGRVRGKEVETATMKISADGKTLTVATTGSNAGTDYSNNQIFNRK
jgi:hypothetical protein